MKTFSLTIVERRNETLDSCTLCFKQPGLQKIKYKAGQYITLIFRIKGRKYARAYSLSSTPSLNQYLEITVKRVINGVVSNYICDELKVGDIIEVSEPMGSFVSENANSFSSVYLWGVGSGITPLFSIINDLLNKGEADLIHLIYGNKNIDSTIFYHHLDSLVNAYSPRFKMTCFFSHGGIDIEDEFNYLGRINPNFINSLFSKEESIKNCVHFICGPKPVKNDISNVLEKLNFPKSSIFIEEFGKVIDSKEFEFIQNSKVKIKFRGEEFDIFVPIGRSILDVALDHNIDIPYACQTGDCSTCMAIIKDGQSKMLGLTKQRDDLLDNELLLCCSYPLSDRLVLEII